MENVRDRSGCEASVSVHKVDADCGDGAGSRCVVGIKDERCMDVAKVSADDEVLVWLSMLLTWVRTEGDGKDDVGVDGESGIGNAIEDLLGIAVSC
jgi:hypothetical protein